MLKEKGKHKCNKGTVEQYLNKYGVNRTLQKNLLNERFTKRRLSQTLRKKKRLEDKVIETIQTGAQEEKR